MMLLATIYNQEKNYKSRAAAYEKLLALIPTFSPALNNLAYIIVNTLPVDRAYELAQKARSFAARRSSTADTLVGFLYGKASLLQPPPVQESANKLPAEPDVNFI